MKFSKILVVFDPTKEEQPALDRAVTIAQETGASLHLFACIYSDQSKAADKPGEVKALIALQKSELSTLAQPIIDSGVAMTIEVEWDENWYKAVTRASLRQEADLVLKSTFKHASHQRILNRSSDWTLIRECLCPVLLVREGSKSRDIRKVLAAIDTRTNKKNYARLNENIIDFGQRVIARGNPEVHFINAYQGSLEYPDRAKLVESCGVENNRVHIKQGDPEKVIIENAKSMDAAVVVIGTSGRTGFEALLNGNTAEKILDELECDILAMP